MTARVIRVLHAVVILVVTQGFIRQLHGFYGLCH